MASATELVIAFVMGLGGSLKYALSGLVDIRLAMIILAGSLFGIQLGLIQRLSDTAVKLLKTTSFAIMISALLIGAFIILRAFVQGRRAG